MSGPDLVRGLLSDNVEHRSLAFEATILEALEIDALDVDRLAEAYRFLSGALLSRSADEASGAFTPPKKAGFSQNHVLAVWGLIYGWRTFEMARRLMLEFEPSPGLAVEIGGGWGPYALQASLRGFSARIIEVSDLAAPMTRAVFERLGLPVPERIHRPAAHIDGRGASLVALPYSFWEIRDLTAEPGKNAHWLDRWRSNGGENAQVHVLEAGSRDASRGVQAVRDVLGVRKLVSGPCRGASSCPRLEADDWCHFTWRSSPGSLTRQVADLAKRRWQEVHSSWLVLGAAAQPEPSHRVLDVRRRGKAKAQVEVCGPEGLVKITALLRDRSLSDVFEELDPGDLVTVKTDGLVEKGDGLRVLSADHIRITRKGA